MVQAPDTLLALWRMMVRIRAFETRLAAEYEIGDIRGHIHLCIGQEAIAAGVCAALAPDDVITSTHRGHGHALAKGCDPAAMMTEILGRASGLCGGLAGSMHLADPVRGLLASTGIVGANAPLALGAALTAKTLASGQVAVCFLGDGAANQGAVLESLNLAAALTLPCLFVIEDNGYGEFTASNAVTGTSDLVARCSAFGMPAQAVNGADVCDVLAATESAVARARSGRGPSSLVCKVSRLGGHFEGDPQAYREEAEPPRIGGDTDPLAHFRRRVAAERTIDPADLSRIERHAAEEMSRAIEAARSAPWPDAVGLRQASAGARAGR